MQTYYGIYYSIAAWAWRGRTAKAIQGRRRCPSSWRRRRRVSVHKKTHGGFRLALQVSPVYQHALQRASCAKDMHKFGQVWPFPPLHSLLCMETNALHHQGWVACLVRLQSTPRQRWEWLEFMMAWLQLKKIHFWPLSIYYWECTTAAWKHENLLVLPWSTCQRGVWDTEIVLQLLLTEKSPNRKAESPRLS